MNIINSSGIAYLVLAHKRPGLFEKLIDWLDHPNDRFFVHVDVKTSIDPWNAVASRDSRVVLIAERRPVYWSGFNMVHATRELMRHAIDYQHPRLDRLCLLSGQCLPIKPASTLRELLLCSDEQWVRIERRLDQTNRTEFASRLRRRHFVDHPLLNPKRRDKLAFTAQRLSRRLLKRYDSFSPPKWPVGIVPYHGSQWWAMTRECAEDMLKSMSSDNPVWRFCKKVETPDEILIQTLVGNSRFADKIRHHYEHDTCRGEDRGSHYIDWSSKGCPLPKSLDLEDFGNLYHSSCLFARKFDESSKTLIQSLEERVYGSDVKMCT